jgi:anti-sigma factor RsiW
VTCREFAEFLGDYFSGELQPDVRTAFERHLSRCENCARYLAGYQETMKLGRAAFADVASAPPDDVPTDLVEAILAARKSAS